MCLGALTRISHPTPYPMHALASCVTVWSCSRGACAVTMKPCSVVCLCGIAWLSLRNVLQTISKTSLSSTADPGGVMYDLVFSQSRRQSLRTVNIRVWLHIAVSQEAHGRVHPKELHPPTGGCEVVDLLQIRSSICSFGQLLRSIDCADI